MERRKALVVASAVTISALAGATAVGASTGLLGFGGGGADPAPAAVADPPATETRIVHLPAHTAPKPAAGPSATGGTRRSSGATGLASAPSVPSPSAGPVMATESAPPSVTPPPATVEAPEPPEVEDPGEHEVEPPEAPEAPEPGEHETGD